jgi:predicted amidohydrolase
LRFPEIHRILSLKGAEIIVNVTSLPKNLRLECHQNLLGPTRALENKVYFVSANRVGRGEGFTFLGRSQIIDLNGNIIVEGGQEKEEIIHARIEPRRARNKGVELNPAEDLFEDRRPELYGPIVGEGFS